MFRKSMRIIKFLTLALIAFTFQKAQAQDPEIAFHAGAQAYIGGDVPLARKIVSDGLRYNPSDPKLIELMKKLEEKEQQNQEQQKQEQQNQNKKDQEKGDKTEENQEEEQKQQQKPENGEMESQKDQDENPEESQEQEQVSAEPQQVEDQKISKEKALMILEAMRNNEIQYIQQQQKKPKRDTPDNKPDW